MYRALRTEIERNLELADSTRDMIVQERDMLQGDVKQRVVLYQFHTDVWDMLVGTGNLDVFSAPDVLASCYERLKEVNDLITKFNEVGDAILHAPLLNRGGNTYGRDHVIDIIKERCEEVEHGLQDAYRVVEERLDRTCPYCDTVVADASDLEPHIRQNHGDIEP